MPTWTSPRTWTDGELVTKAIMDPHIRDNLNATWRFIARKTADQSVTSSTVLVDDTHLVLAAAASDVWALEYRLRVVAAAASDIKFAWTFPTSGEVEFYITYWSAAGVADSHAVYATTSPSASFAIQPVNASTNVNAVTIQGNYVGGGNAGNVTLQWAQQASGGTATTLKANSCLLGMKLA